MLEEGDVMNGADGHSVECVPYQEQTVSQREPLKVSLSKNDRKVDNRLGCACADQRVSYFNISDRREGGKKEKFCIRMGSTARMGKGYVTD